VLYLYYVSCVALSECVSASVWCPVVLEHFVCGMFWCFMHLYGWFYAWAVPTWFEACWCYVAGLAAGDVVSECRLNHYWPVPCGPWGLRGLWPLGTRGCIAWALFGIELHYIRSNNPQSAYALHILQNQHEYGPMDNTMTLLKHINNQSLLLPYEQYHIEALHHHRRCLGKKEKKKTTHARAPPPLSLSHCPKRVRARAHTHTHTTEIERERDYMVNQSTEPCNDHKQTSMNSGGWYYKFEWYNNFFWNQGKYMTNKTNC